MILFTKFSRIIVVFFWLLIGSLKTIFLDCYWGSSLTSLLILPFSSQMSAQSHNDIGSLSLFQCLGRHSKSTYGVIQRVCKGEGVHERIDKKLHKGCEQAKEWSFKVSVRQFFLQFNLYSSLSHETLIIL